MNKDRPDDLTQNNTFCDIYKAFLAINLPWQAKYKSFDTILWASGLIDHMVVIGISRDALSLIKENGFKKSNPTVVRGHRHARIDRGQLLFGERRWPFEKAFELYREYDQVVLITRAENGVKVDPDTGWSEVYSFPKEESLFPWRTAGFSATYSNKALDYLKKLAKQKL